MNSIPASQLVDVIPGVLGAGGNPLSLNAVFLTETPTLQIDADAGYIVKSFATAADVAAFFGGDSEEAQAATIYFSGFSNASTLPGLLYFVRFNTDAVGAWLRGGSLAGTTLAQLQALSGTIQVDVDGRTVLTPNIDLSSATSFSNAADLITAGLRAVSSVFQGTANQTATSTTMTVTAVATGALHVGDILTGSGVDSGLTIVAQLTGSPGGIGTYQVSTNTGFSSTTVHVTSSAFASWNAQLAAFQINSNTTGTTSVLGSYAAGSLGAPLKLQQPDGAILSQGAAIATPARVLGDVVNQTQNWASFMTLREYDVDTKVAFAAWANASVERYMYVGWGTNEAGILDGPVADCFAQLTKTYDGRVAIFGDFDKGAFICGMTAAINFDEENGRITYAYKSQPGLVPDITNATQANNLLGNGYIFYGAYATANDQFQFLQNGQISGQWKWIDPYVNQIKLNSDLQLAFITLLTQVKSLPYVTRGYDQVRAAALGPITSALNFGSIVAGVTLSASQRQQVNTAAGTSIADILQSRGWYLKISDANPVTRGNRGTPPMTLWYTDGGSIQKLTLASIDVQ